MVTVTYVIMGVTWFGLGAKPFDLYVACGTIGVLLLLVAYALATLGAARILFFSGRREVARWEVAVPALALLLIGYTLVRNTWPYPSGVPGAYPAISAAWLLAGVAWVILRPAATRRAGRLLIADDGLHPAHQPR